MKIRIEEDAKREYEVLPEGTYEVYVDAYDMPEQMGDYERSSILLKIRDDIEQDSKNRVIYVNLNTNPNIAWKLSKIAVAAGVPAGTDFDTFIDYLGALRGASMKVVVKHREYNGKIYPDVKQFYPTSEVPFSLEETFDANLI